jgi:hypothetical protein
MRLMTILTCCLLANALSAQTSTWVKAVDGSLSRTGHSLAPFNNRIWSLGGRAADAGAPSTPNGPLTSEIWSTADGITWTMDSLCAPWAAREGHAAVEFNGRLWVIGGEADIWSSADGTTWSRECGNPGWGKRQWHTCVVMNGQMWVIGGSENGTEMGDVWSSADGVNWNMVTSFALWGPRKLHVSVVFNGRMWVLGGTQAGTARRDVWSSADGANWTLEDASADWTPRDRHAASVLNGRIYVLSGKLNGYAPVADVWSSQDGVTWSEDCHSATWGMRSSPGCMILNNELWVIGGAEVDGVGFTDAWSSPDGGTWTSRAPRVGLAPGRLGEATCVFNNRYWKIGGGTSGSTVYNDIWSSADGVNWTQVLASAPFSERSGHTLEVLNGRMYMLGGEAYMQIKGEVWSTADGVNWTLDAMHPWPALPGNPGYGGRTVHFSTVFNGRIWVMGGITNLYSYSPDVWSSSDGITWTLEGSSFPQDLGNAQLREFNGAMWLFGGDIYGANVWSSADGATWNLQTSSAPWGQRQAHASTVHAGRMWLMAGSAPGTKNDLWSTADGLNWVQETPITPFSPARLWASASVLNSRVFMHGGWDGVYQAPFYRSQDSWFYVDNGAAPQFTNAPTTTAIAGNAFCYTPTFVGTPAPKLSVAGSLPAWLEINSATGMFSGTPAVADVGTSQTITLTVANAFGSDSLPFQITVLGPAPQITSTPITGATAGMAYSYTVSAVGGPPAPALSASGLPAWLSFDTSTGALTGMPGVGDIGLSGSITITASNGTPPDAVQVFEILVSGTSPTITSTPVTTAYVGNDYLYAVTATGLPAPTFSANSLPAWLSFNSATGELSGRPGIGAVGTCTIEITATTGFGPDAVQQFTIDVPDPMKQKGGAGGGSAGCAGSDGGMAWCAVLALLATAFAMKGMRRRA